MTVFLSSWATQLDTIFSKHLLEEAKLHRVHVHKSQRLFLAHVHLMTFEDVCSSLEAGGKVEEAQMGQKLIATIRGELMSGVYTSHDYLCTIGRKAF